MYTNHRQAYRQAFFAAWQKQQKQLPLEPVEQQIVAAIQMHPEYQPLLDRADQYEKQEFELEENPFFHLSLHVAIHEQIRLNRPQGITTLYEQLMTAYQDAHEVEHQMMACLTEMMWQAQQTGQAMNESEYLEKIRSQCGMA